MNIRQTCAVSAVFAVALHLAGCERGAPTPDAAQSDAAMMAPQSATPTGVALAVPAPASSAPAVSEPAMTNRSARPEDVLAGWAVAIERRDWQAVRALWGDKGAASGLSQTEFARRWDLLRSPRVTVGAGEQEGAAGSLYYQAPVRIVDGGKTISGTVTIRRVNDVNGATAEQLRWHADASLGAPWTNPSA